MQNEVNPNYLNPYSFLSNEEIERKFADINIKLLRGRHIQKSTDLSEYMILSQQEHFENLKLFYNRLYKLELYKRQAELLEAYFYLDYFDEGRGALAPADRHIKLSKLQTIVGLMILLFKYEKLHFERIKQLSWHNIKEAILYSEQQDNYKHIFFGEIREGNNYSDLEWGRLKGHIKNAILRFNDLGWVSATVSEDFPFIINTSIHRLENLYKDELDYPQELFTKIRNKGKVNEQEDESELS